RDATTYGPAVYALLSVDPERVDARAAAADLVQDLGRNTYREFDPAAKALGMIGRPAVVHILAALRSGTSRMRRQACVALGEMGPQAEIIIPELIEEARAGDPALRPYVLRALGRIGEKPDEVVPVLVGFLDDPKVWHAAAGALGDLGAKAHAAVGELKKRLRHRDETAREYYAAALRKIERALKRQTEEPPVGDDVF
ncbi:MAG: HEAT repeat domain-containing protein, partial [Planctomycetota bacterium]